LDEVTIFVYSAGKLIAEYSTAPPPQDPTTKRTVTDQLGSPRILVNSLGEGVSRRDFMPFGEEIFPDGAHRTTNLKYNFGDNVRQKFTGYQKDEETQLDFADARMYQNLHGRFTAVDPLLASGKSANPQTFNRYVYVLNNPLAYTDPTGLQAGETIEEVPDVISVNTYWDNAKNAFGTWTGYLKSLGVSVEQAIRYYAYTSGGEEDFDTRTTSGPVVRQSGGILNPTTGPAVTAFNNNMENFNQQVVQRVPLLSNLVNAQMAGRDNDYVGFATELGTFQFDLATTLFTGGTSGTLRRGAQEGVELTGVRLAQSLGRQGEEAVGILGPKRAIDSITGTAVRRFPDQITETSIFEVKNVRHLNFTNQIRDSYLYSQR
jgi:RHS repeat-associated protein